MSETAPNEIRGGAPCAKELLCNPPALARAENEARLKSVLAQNEADLKCAWLKGFSQLTDYVRTGCVILTPEQADMHRKCSNAMAFDDEFQTLVQHLWQLFVVKTSEEK